MKHYLIIQSQDPFTQTNAEQHYALAHALAQAGNEVHLLLVQHGVSVARRNVANSAFEQLLNGSVKVYADRYALAEREFEAAELHPGIAVTELDLVADALLAGDNVIWH